MNLYNSHGAPSEFENNESSTIDGYSQLNVYDWLANIPLPPNQQIFNIVEIKFKGARKDFYLKPESMSLKQTDIVIVETIGGHDVGHVSLTGELVRLQLKKHNILKEEVIRKIYRKATSADIKKWKTAKGLESKTMYKARMLAKDLDLKMKICDVDYQGDNTKATFYYTADKRVDFRELILVLAATFHVKIKMRQISVLEEASRLGGIGTCGREFCHSTWLTDFNTKSTLHNKNKDKQWTEFKCCLIEDWGNKKYSAEVNNLNSIKTLKGIAHLQKTDIEKQIMWFSYPDEADLIPIKIARAKEVQTLIKEGMILKDLKEEVEAIIEEAAINNMYKFANVVGQDSLTRFNKKGKNKRKKGGK
ncbi:PSP1 domain-containing protein [Patiriisocius sp. Uisw_017]|jgi:cell fate regulator YaaT (PSP1 superfamily)|uniref:PSP1 domain-containing protein n=1 Tax=Patiriisocius sp. Uisw_017 TaxID=3230968 RepID=UPI0039E87A0D